MQNVIYWNPGMTIDAMEKTVIRMALKHFGGNKSAASRALGISPRSLTDKIQLYEKEDLAIEEARKKDLEDREILLRKSRGEKIPEASSAPLIRVEPMEHSMESLPPVLPEPAQVQKKIQVDISRSSPAASRVGTPVGVRQVR